jgi:hypothetical protein
LGALHGGIVSTWVAFPFFPVPHALALVLAPENPNLEALDQMKLITTGMNDYIKQFLRFTSEDELIRLAEIGLAVEMHRAAQRFFHSRMDVPYTEETAAKLQAYLELNPGGSCSGLGSLLPGRNNRDFHEAF